MDGLAGTQSMIVPFGQSRKLYNPFLYCLIQTYRYIFANRQIQIHRPNSPILRIVVEVEESHFLLVFDEYQIYFQNLKISIQNFSQKQLVFRDRAKQLGQRWVRFGSYSEVFDPAINYGS